MKITEQEFYFLQGRIFEANQTEAFRSIYGVLTQFEPDTNIRVLAIKYNQKLAQQSEAVKSLSSLVDIGHIDVMIELDKASSAVDSYIHQKYSNESGRFSFDESYWPVRNTIANETNQEHRDEYFRFFNSKIQDRLEGFHPKLFEARLKN